MVSRSPWCFLIANLSRITMLNYIWYQHLLKTDNLKWFQCPPEIPQIQYLSRAYKDTNSIQREEKNYYEAYNITNDFHAELVHTDLESKMSEENKPSFLHICFFSFSLPSHAKYSYISYVSASRQHLLQFVCNQDINLSCPTSTNLFYLLCPDTCFQTCRSLIFTRISPLLQFRESWSTNSEAVVERQEKVLHQYDHNLIPCCNSAFILSLIHAKETCSLLLYFSYAPCTWHNQVS